MERYLYANVFSCYRSYISFDILRRILSNYFGYDVLYVMNITDIDDKIIKRARQNYLYEKYVKQDRNLDDMLNNMKAVISTVEETVTTTTDPDKKCMIEKMLYKIIKAIEDLEKAVKGKNEKQIALYQKVLFDAKNFIFKVIFY